MCSLAALLLTKICGKARSRGRTFPALAMTIPSIRKKGPSMTDKAATLELDQTYAPRADFSRSAHVDAAKYDEMYRASITDPEGFWGEHGKRLDWIRP
ncbi:acetyl-coenzyme A synthetase N-terminal domain-containing protein, partial [Rhodovulum bhavnagarense]